LAAIGIQINLGRWKAQEFHYIRIREEKNEREEWYKIFGFCYIS